MESSALHALAEDPHAFLPLDPGTERVVNDRYVLRCKPSSARHSNVALRLRFGTLDAMTAGIQEIRAHVAARANRQLTWLVGSSATPAGLAERLVELGAIRHSIDPVLSALVLVEPPEAGPPNIVVKRATTRAEFAAARTIECSELSDEEEDSPEEREREFVRQCQSSARAQYLALEGDIPIATGRAIFAEHGVSMSGAATLATHRSRGAYRALVRARWLDAVERGTPALVTHAGCLSKPILLRLGFNCVAEVALLMDDVSA